MSNELCLNDLFKSVFFNEEAIDSIENWDKIEGYCNTNLTKTSELGEFSSLVKKDLNRQGIKSWQDSLITNQRYYITIEKNHRCYSEKSLVLEHDLIAYPFLFFGNVYLIVATGYINKPVVVINFTNEKLEYIYPHPIGSKLIIRKLFSHLKAKSKELTIYLSSQTQEVSTIISRPHLGHSIWNDIAALQRLEDKGISISDLYLTNNADPFKVAYKYKDIVRNSILYFNNEALCDYIYERASFIVRVSDTFISQNAISKVLSSLSVEKPEPDNHSLTVVIGLRVENRTIENQHQLYLGIIEYLVEKVKNRRIKVIIDGHNAPSIYEEHSLETLESIKKEFEIFNYLSENYLGNNVTITQSINKAYKENIQELLEADLVICPWGAGLVKYKWICNLDTLIISSQWNLDNRVDLNIYCDPNTREGISKSEFVESQYITDIVGSHEREDKCNFKVNAQGVYEKLDILLGGKL